MIIRDNDIVIKINESEYNFYLVMDVKQSDDKALVLILGCRRHGKVIKFTSTKETELVPVSILLKLF